MKICLLFTLQFLLYGMLLGQTLNSGWRNHEYSTKQFSDIDGSPFLYEDWYRGKVIGSDGRILEDILLKYEAYSEYLIYMQEGKVFELSGEILSFSIFPEVEGMKDSLFFRKGYPAADENTMNTFYEVLVDGKASLLKSHRKTTALSSQNALVSNKRDFILEEELYIALGKQPPLRVKKDRNNLLDILKDRKAELAEWLDKKKVNLKREDGIAELVTRYNSL